MFQIPLVALKVFKFNIDYRIFESMLQNNLLISIDSIIIMQCTSFLVLNLHMTVLVGIL